MSPNRSQQPIALFPASFDPVTNGHLDLVKRTRAIFSQVVERRLVEDFATMFHSYQLLQYGHQPGSVNAFSLRHGKAVCGNIFKRLPQRFAFANLPLLRVPRRREIAFDEFDRVSRFIEVQLQ